MSKHSLPGTSYIPLLNALSTSRQKTSGKYVAEWMIWIRFGSQNSASTSVICSGHLWSLFQSESLGDAKDLLQHRTAIATDSLSDFLRNWL